jgi:catechol 2,3-dioxygenase-like lactoylglutathione lyase family enzyme
MITDAPIHPSLAVADLARARSWYADKLGWEPTVEPPGTLVYEVGDSAFTLFETEFAGTAKNTVMNWNVPDLQAAIARLRERGVAFEEYDFGEYKTVDGVMTFPNGDANAWFKDSEGNIIGMPWARDMVPTGEAVGAMIAAADLGRAKAWYADKLSLAPIAESDGVVLTYASGNSKFNVYQTELAGTAKNTVAVWRFKGVRDEVARLRARGVEFEDYDFGEEKTVGGILSDADGNVNAWFKDSEGNILALVEDRA